ncbi:hypothetical protein PR048_014375 [Dryococelus australis]|uniref:Reverse transcriptase n=1 Tax=Dryococelus australis TaxID=614101 RepID=A0ABQ9HE78_9NEOP|nr:hypothetical protein PR048_014375 [Dryococelus australis]
MWIIKALNCTKEWAIARHTMGRCIPREFVEKLAEQSPHSHLFSEKHLKRKLTEHYGENINITHLPGKQSVINCTLKEEPTKGKKIIIIAAANLIQQEILSQPYECDFFQTVGRNQDRKYRACRRIIEAHQIIAALWTRSLISPLQIGLGIFLHRRFGSNYLIDLLSNLGICSSYHEVARYESSIMHGPL